MLITPLPQGFGVEVSDFDVANGRDPAEVAQLVQAWREHHLIVFRGESPVEPERQVEITGWFGPLITDSGRWTVLDNAEPSGRFVLPFHSDITFCEFPLAGISLCPQELPSGDTSTTYISNALGWRHLPSAVQQQLAERKARHSFRSDRDIYLGIDEFEYWHPACLPHPETGTPLLFVTEHHVDRIEGLSDAESAAALEAAFAALYASERRYEHVWRWGDMIVWDNLAIQHARTRVAVVADGRRVVRRVQLGKVSFPQQLALLKQRQMEAQ